jgi:pimeloyl-ACP methyl ester carboxylesterase
MSVSQPKELCGIERSRLERVMRRQGEERRGGDSVRGAPPVGRHYDVEGRRLLLHRSGTGRPAVVFVPGAGLVGLDYLNIHDAVAKLTTSVVYDRAATGWSDPVELPRTAAAVADELRGLLHAADVPAPYVLVGHSLGGFYARRFAQRFPEEVAGLLFLDPAHEDYPADVPKQKMLSQLRQALALLRLFVRVKKFYRGQFERMFAGWPDSVRGPLVEYHLCSLRKSLQEWPAHLRRNAEGGLCAEIRGGGDTPDVPLIVLTAMGIDPFMAAFMPQAFLRQVNEGKSVMYRAFAESVPRGEHRVVENAGHTTIHTDRPDAVVQAIRDLLDRVKG